MIDTRNVEALLGGGYIKLMDISSCVSTLDSPHSALIAVNSYGKTCNMYAIHVHVACVHIILPFSCINTVMSGLRIVLREALLYKCIATLKLLNSRSYSYVVIILYSNDGHNNMTENTILFIN